MAIQDDAIQDDPLEDLMSVEKAVKIIPSRPHTGTVIRWSTRGVGGVKLQTVRVGGRRFVSRRALMEFVSALTEKVDGGIASVATKSSRRRNIEAAERELDSRLTAKSGRSARGRIAGPFQQTKTANTDDTSGRARS